MKMPAVVVMAVLLLSGMVLSTGCGETIVPEKVESTTPASPVAPVVSEPSKEKPRPEIFSVGDTVKMGKFIMTLNSVRWDEGNQFAKPDEGTRWLVANITLNNESEEPTAVSSLMMFSLIDDEHYSCDWAVFASTKGSVDGELGPSRSMRGEIAWEVDDGGSAWELVFEPDLFGSGQAVFKINQKDVSE